MIWIEIVSNENDRTEKTFLYHQPTITVLHRLKILLSILINVHIKVMRHRQQLKNTEKHEKH